MPDYLEITEALAGAQYAKAERLIRAEIALAADNSPKMHELLSESLRRQGRAAEALAVCEQLTAVAPERASGWHETGRVLNNLGRLQDARLALARARALAPGDAAIHHDLAHVARRLGDIDSAREGFTEATQLRPEWASAWYRLGALELSAENFEAAEKRLRKAVEIEPHNTLSLTTLGVALHRLGRQSEAREFYQQAIQQDPDNAEAWGNLGICLQDSGKVAPAIEAYRKALELQPDDFQAAFHLGDALLAANDPDRALKTSEQLLQKFPGHSGALATRSIALLRTGAAADYAGLVDFERLIMPVVIERPSEFPDMRTFNNALASHVLKHQSLRFEPSGHATRHGHHTSDLLRFDKGPVAALERAVGKAFELYRDILRNLSGHPLADSAPGAWRLSMWSVVMQSHGHQLPHIHPTAWLSGVYYARVPGVVTADDDTQAGWIEFGRPPEELSGDTEFPVRRFAPREGLMFLFPSYLYHQTIPYQSDEQRISLAFDIAPAPVGGATIK